MQRSEEWQVLPPSDYAVVIVKLSALHGFHFVFQHKYPTGINAETPYTPTESHPQQLDPGLL